MSSEKRGESMPPGDVLAAKDGFLGMQVVQGEHMHDLRLKLVTTGSFYFANPEPGASAEQFRFAFEHGKAKGEIGRMLVDMGNRMMGDEEQDHVRNDR